MITTVNQDYGVNYFHFINQTSVSLTESNIFIREGIFSFHFELISKTNIYILEIEIDRSKFTIFPNC